MVGLLYWVIQCTWYVKLYLFYSAIRCKWSDYYICPYGVQGMFILICSISPYGENGWIIILGPMVYRAFLIILPAIRCKRSDCYIGPYGVQGMFILMCSIPPYGENGWTRNLVSTVYRVY